jgi:phosphate transport system substrate-binding protein
MTPDQMQAAGAEIFHIPTALGAVVATYNIPELSTPLRLTAEMLAGIYLGQITNWSDPALTSENPELASLDKSIVVVHRSDGSGTSFIFTDYLSSVSPAWSATVGTGTSVNWPTGLGAQGNPGVAGEVKQNPYSIGYVELIYALQNRLGVADVRNSAGVFITPTVPAVTAAAAGIADTIADDLRASIVNAPGADAYPISGFTWLLAYQEMADQAKAIAFTRMAWWAIHEGQSANTELGYAPLPQGIVARAEAKIMAITTGGQPAFPGQ